MYTGLEGDPWDIESQEHDSDDNFRVDAEVAPESA